MKLVTTKGELPLEEDFSFSVEQHSPFFSDQGAATIPSEIPADRQTLSRFGYPDRLGRTSSIVKKLPATLYSGVFQKTGQLIIDSYKDSFTASLALEDSTLYAEHKEKNIRDIFADYIREDFSTIEAWAGHFHNVSRGFHYMYDVHGDPVDQYPVTDDFMVFPVAVNYNEDTDSYLILNRPLGDGASGIIGFNWYSKEITQDGKVVACPEGYAMSAFLKLHRFIELLFAQLGYSVTVNPFATDSILKRLVLLNNTADVICTGKLHYADLVPDITVGEWIDFLLKKFHAQLRVIPSVKEISLVLMEDILSGSWDMDLTGELDGKFEQHFSESSRVVLSSDTSLQGAEPAAKTLEALFEKYKNYIPLNEADFQNIDSLGYQDCLVLRLATGQFYELQRDVLDDTQTPVRVGSNYFTYNRANSLQTEDMQAQDLMPPMVYASNILMPYIGDAINRHTVVAQKEEKEDSQPVMLCYDAGQAAALFYRLGTTQKYNDNGLVWSDQVQDLNAYALYDRFWKQYNELLLNGLVVLKGKIDLDIQSLLKYNLFSLKLFKGQKLLPKFLSYEVGKTIQFNESEFVLVKDYKDKLSDTLPQGIDTALKWELNTSQLDAIKADILAQDSMRFIFSVDYMDSGSFSESVFLGVPSFAGEVTYKVTRSVRITYGVYVLVDGELQEQVQGVAPAVFQTWYDAVPLVP